MEKLSGVSLLDYINNLHRTNENKLSSAANSNEPSLCSSLPIINEEDIAKIMKNLLEAVKYTHSLNLMHRDIKPENILFGQISNLDSLKLIDFGLGRKFQGIHDLIDQEKCGTFIYMAPEQLGIAKGMMNEINKDIERKSHHNDSKHKQKLIKNKFNTEEERKTKDISYVKREDKIDKYQNKNKIKNKIQEIHSIPDFYTKVLLNLECRFMAMWNNSLYAFHFKASIL